MADPLRGVRTRPLDLPGQRGAGVGAALGLVAVVIVLGVAGFLAVGAGDLLGSGGQFVGAVPSGGPGSDATPAAGSPGPAGSGAQATARPDATPRTAEAGTRTAFKCEAAFITDPTGGSWRMARFESGARDKWDEVSFQLEREGEGEGEPLKVGMEWMTPAEAAERYGVKKPVGARALVVTFGGPAMIQGENLQEADLKAVRTVDVRMGEDDVLRAVVGVRGQGCARLASPQWSKAGDDASARIELAVKYE